MRTVKSHRKPSKKSLAPTPEEIERAQMQMLQAKLQKRKNNSFDYQLVTYF